MSHYLMNWTWRLQSQHSQVFRKETLHSQWALPSSGHPCPWSPPSSWGIGHLCPVWWQRGNCLNVHTTDTHTCFIHAFGLAWGASQLPVSSLAASFFSYNWCCNLMKWPDPITLDFSIIRNSKSININININKHSVLKGDTKWQT